MTSPYKIGDRVSILLCGPFVITDVIPKGGKWEYKAEYKGNPFLKHWKCDLYSHVMVDILEAIE